MEVKVWMNGYQRIVSGVTEQTTCQDLMVALAQASGITGRYSMFEKWRNIEHCLSPAEYPLLVLQKWGEYSNDVQFILHHSGPADKRRNVHPIQGRFLKSGPPERATLKKSLTFSGVHRRAHSVDQLVSSGARTGNSARNGCHSLESSEQSSVASQSSASLSPYTSLERQISQKNGNEFAFGNLQKERLTVTELKRNFFSEQKCTVSKETASNTSSQETQYVMGNALSNNGLHSVRPQPPVPSSRQSKLRPTGLVKSQIPRPDQNVGKETAFNGPRKVSANGDASEMSRSKPDSSIISPSPKSSNSNSPNPSPSSPAGTHSNVPLHFSKNFDASDENLVIDSSSKTRVLVLPPPKMAAEFHNSHKIKTNNKISLQNLSESKESERTKLPYNANKQLNPPVPAKRYQLSNDVRTNPLSQPPMHPDSQRISSHRAPLLRSSSDEVDSSKSSTSFDESRQLKSSDDESQREEKERKALIELISRQEDELQKCESRLKELNYEILLFEGDSEVDEKHLESQLKKLAELEALEKSVETELQELELVSWEEKLEMEKQKENRLQTEILLIQSSVEKSETEIQTSALKMKGLKSKTEDATKELNQFLKKKQEKEQKEIDELEEDLRRVTTESRASDMSLKSLEEKIGAADNCFSKKKDDLAELECDLKRLNLELFCKYPPEVMASRRPILSS